MNDMNERILELAKQAGLQPYYDAQEQHIQKFAELIIKECVDCIYIDEHSPSYEAVGRIYDYFRKVES